MILSDFEKEKCALNIDDTVNASLGLMESADFNKVVKILKPVTDKFEKGIQLQNSEKEEFYSFSDNIEYFTKVIENVQNNLNSEIYALNPNYSRMYHLLGYAYVELGKIKEAQISLQNSLKWNPVSAGTYLELAEIFKRSAQWDNFLPLAHYGLIYSKTPITFARSLRGLGYYFCENNNYDLAVALYMHSLQFEDNKEIVGTEVGYMYEMSGKTLKLPSPEDAVKTILENGIIFEISDYVFAGYTKFLQALKEANRMDVYSSFEETLRKMTFTPDKIKVIDSI